MILQVFQFALPQPPGKTIYVEVHETLVDVSTWIGAPRFAPQQVESRC